MNEKEHSVTANRRQILVPASPLNPVKLELGLISLIVIATFFVVERWVTSDVWQWVILMFTGLSAMSWLILRTKSVVKRHQQLAVQASGKKES